VFVVGHLGDWKPAAEVLFESESLRGDIKKGRKEGQDPAKCLTTRIRNDFETESFVYENHAQDSRVKEVTISPTVSAKWGTGGGNVPIAMQGNLIGRDAGGPNGVGVSDSNTMYTLTKADVHAVAFGWQNSQSQGMSVDSISPTLDKSKTPAVFCDTYNGTVQGDVCATMTADMAGPTHSGTKVMQNMAVRRLTPVECERLQGFPDNYTNIPKAADGNRYKALGNSMAVPVMRWIGERINQYEQRGVEKHL
jgi:DNA (cytosine-5)-methyltransferase 1